MILIPGDSDISKALEERSSKPVPEDSPPSYTASEAPGPSSLAALNLSVPNVQPCNFVSVSRKDSSIKGTWLLDPMLSIPSELLPPLPAGESERTRKNLSLQTKDGSINANIFVLLTTAEELQKADKMNQRTLIDAATKDGPVTVRMHEVHSQQGEVRLPIQLRSSSLDGAIRVYLPRSFRGIFRIKVKSGKIRFSKAIESSSTPFSEVNGLKISFLGLFDAAEWQPGVDWNGDELILETTDGNVSVLFDDEENGPAQTRKGLLSKIFKF